MNSIVPTIEGQIELEAYLQHIASEMHSDLPEECNWAVHGIIELAQETKAKIANIKQYEEYVRLTNEFESMNDVDKSMLLISKPKAYGKYQHAQKMANLPAVSTTADLLKALKT